MLFKCANPVCSKPFRRLDEGKLFQVETEHFPVSSIRQSLPSRRGRVLRQHVERYWLCDECAASLTLTFERGHGISVTPLPGIPRKISTARPSLGKLKGVLREAGHQALQ